MRDGGIARRKMVGAVCAAIAVLGVYSTSDLRSYGHRISKHQWLKLCSNYAQDEANSMFEKDTFLIMFQSMDVKRRGVITVEALQAFFKTTGLGTTLEQTKILAESINRYGIGDTVTEEEFFKFMLKRSEITKINKRQRGDREEQNDGGHNSESSVDVTQAFGFY